MIRPWAELIALAAFATQGLPSAYPLLTDFSHKNYYVELMIGEFEYLILAAAAKLGDGAYGAAIRLEIEEATRERCSIGALYTTLDRLEGKGLVKTGMGDPTPQRGGRAKRMVRITAAGTEAASEFYAAIAKLTRGVTWQTSRAAVRS